ncbi:Proteasome assembly chaperone 3 [Macleaya cordata]|uniref:Proteasome assembly chaperone 3 n=1 Tax=Macleaya cordata TaxID=56857 RepID=A0A200R2Q7_MACCD|nr:Proteasome assembly chaperone 3 [Macleaya cordata]
MGKGLAGLEFGGEGKKFFDGGGDNWLGIAGGGGEGGGGGKTEASGDGDEDKEEPVSGGGGDGDGNGGGECGGEGGGECGGECGREGGGECGGECGGEFEGGGGEGGGGDEDSEFEGGGGGVEFEPEGGIAFDDSGGGGAGGDFETFYDASGVPDLHTSLVLQVTENWDGCDLNISWRLLFSAFILVKVELQVVLFVAMDHQTTPFPVPHKNLSLVIKGVKTDIVICSYDDHFLVMATQIGSMGTILHARKEEGMAIHPTFSVQVIFGKRDEPMLVACARQLIEQISSSGSSRTLLLSLGLKDHSVETLKAIVSTVIENRLW